MKKDSTWLKEIKDEERPICPCGNKMQVVEYKGYYDEFKFFQCTGSCNIDVERFDTEKEITGQFG